MSLTAVIKVLSQNKPFHLLYYSRNLASHVIREMCIVRGSNACAHVPQLDV